MSHPQHPIYGNPERRGLYQPFAIYSCIPPNTLTSLLSELEDGEDLHVSPHTFPPETSPQEIINHHIEQCNTSDPEVHPLLLVIADREDFHKHGILIAYIDVYCDPSWKVEYMRHTTSEPLPLGSIAVSQTDWDEVLDNAQFGLQWDRYFAKYATRGSFQESSDEDAEREEYFWDMDREFRKALEGVERQRFQLRPVRGEDDDELLRGDDVEEVARVHARVAGRDGEFHESLCVWFDAGGWEERREVTVVRIGESTVSRTLPIAEAANLLVDIAMGERDWE